MLLAHQVHSPTIVLKLKLLQALLLKSNSPLRSSGGKKESGKGGLYSMIREWLEYCHRPLRDVYSKSCIYWLVEGNTARQKKKKKNCGMR